jgi:hypothetical protein
MKPHSAISGNWSLQLGLNRLPRETGNIEKTVIGQGTSTQWLKETAPIHEGISISGNGIHDLYGRGEKITARKVQMTERAVGGQLRKGAELRIRKRGAGNR